jgi:chorismate mutase
MATRALRGAVRVPENTKESIFTATQELLQALIERNELVEENVVSIMFSATSDLNAAFPAEAARLIGWTQPGLLCFQEMAVPGSMSMVLRIMLLWDTDKSQAEMKHCYLGETHSLRDDLD